MGNFGDLLVFVRVVDQKSFSEAARISGLTKSAASKALRRLEESLGTKLINRTTRHLSLTESGMIVYERAVRITEEAAALCNAVDGMQAVPRGTLKVTTSVAFGNLHLSRMVCAFMATYPELQISLSLADRYVDLVEEGFDVAVRLTSRPNERYVARRLSALNYVVCATPGYLDRHAPIRFVDDLAHHNCLSYSLRGDGDQWHFVKPGHEVVVGVSGTLSVNSSESLRVAALEGVGVALLRLPQARI
jgi:DNA-binding transcriptional LysR family regulator